MRILFGILLGIFIFVTFTYDIDIFDGYLLLLCFFLSYIFGMTLYRKKYELLPFPMELRFYDDYLAYYPRQSYTGKLIKKRIVKMKYSDISKIVVESEPTKIFIYGKTTREFYRYKIDDTISDKPIKIQRDSFGIDLDMRFTSDIDFIKIIEENSPFKFKDDKFSDNKIYKKNRLKVKKKRNNGNTELC